MSKPIDLKSRFGLLSPEVLDVDELVPSINELTVDETIRVIGKLESLKAVLTERLRRIDPLHPHHEVLRTTHAILDIVTEGAEDELLDAKEAARRLGFSTRWLYHHADELPFTVRQTSGRLRFSKQGLEAYLRTHRK